VALEPLRPLIASQQPRGWHLEFRRALLDGGGLDGAQPDGFGGDLVEGLGRRLAEGSLSIRVYDVFQADT
jgi:hypothetical protein